MVDRKVERYDVCVVGAGIAGLNALFVASQYLKPGQRMALVDRQPRVGGMWIDVYDYVRLHQPHPFFTAGNIRWDWDKEPAYLATKPEVLAHFQHCLNVIMQRVPVDTYFGWSYESHNESDGRVHTEIVREGAQGSERVVIDSDRLVKALGFNITPNDPLPVSSAHVRSVSPDFCDVRTGEIAASDAPVWVIGGGKTAMDTTHTLLTDHPDREVNMVVGSGTWFLRRDEIYTLRHKWWRGTRINRFSHQLALRYDGTNEAGFHDAYLDRSETKVTPTAASWKLGLLSDSEVSKIRDGARRIVMDRFADVVDGDSGPELVLKTGDPITLQPGSWIVNCTGYLLKDDRPYEPYSSASGKVLSISQRSTTMLFTSYAGYFMTHLLMRDELNKVPLYEFDWDTMDRKSQASGLAAMNVLLHNLMLLLDRLPLSVFLSSGLDPDRWYPAPRRLFGAAAIQRTHKKDLEHYRQTLDTVRERYGVRCGPLEFGP